MALRTQRVALSVAWDRDLDASHPFLGDVAEMEAVTREDREWVGAAAEIGVRRLLVACQAQAEVGTVVRFTA